MEGQDALQAELQHKDGEVEQEGRATSADAEDSYRADILADGEEEEGGEVAGAGLADEAEEEALTSGKPAKPRKLSNLERKLQARAVRQAPRGRPAPRATGEPGEPTDPSLMYPPRPFFLFYLVILCLKSVFKRSILSQRPYFQQLKTMGSKQSSLDRDSMHFYHHHLSFSIGC